MSTFEEMKLDPLIMKGVEKMGFTKPTPIQEKTIGPLLKGRDVIGQAKTGSGKTLAFSLPLLHAVDPKSRQVQAIVLAPTRELAVQIAQEMRKLGAHTGVRVVAIYGGQSMGGQREELRRGAHVVVGTTGRVIDHVKHRSLDLRSVKFVVLDEADTMLDMGFIADVDYILGCVQGKKQVCIFSATMPQRIMDLSRKYMIDPERIMVNSDEPSVETLDQYYAVVKHEEKLGFLTDLLQRERPPSAIVFRRTKHGADRLARDLHQKGYQVVPLHGNLSQSQRDRYMDAFRNGRADVLVATDIASRGIDVSQVALVVNYDVPVDPLIYFHRVGRTARAGRDGKAYSFVSKEESGDFGRILKMTKAPILPMRPEDKLHTFVPGTSVHGGGGRRYRSQGGGRQHGRNRYR
ncbi:MAG: DEAD/DEAH box helicase [Nitrososphaerota archaeon]|nr:DEAD/DEAH box helicase [Nitrososphaerota archaeon]MDG6967681.1 DEAD/DEAH box helicase [Nitrososphaerota archaeon]MDG6978166.1 DEAD/DEAH box helicase [Nitrososphaerota archaeon]MDG7021036.1 DEAD/DEAH box helicase [Nitrososphaerota archaeon]MDG7022608.1 DEAD/DEAH box helicase [Nitrososphaerota archaeon]